MLNRLTDSLNFQSEALALRSERQRLIASNIANADTPGYVARDFDFASALAEATGGRQLRASDPSQLRERFTEILREMRARYVLTYTPSSPDTPGWHALTVTLRARKGRVASRAGYIVPGSGNR